MEIKNRLLSFVFRFRDPLLRDEHFNKHKNEDFPITPTNPIHYEALAQKDIKNANYLTLSYAKTYSSSKYNLGLLTFHKQAATTLNIVSNGHQSILHSYYVPKLTFIPEFLVFTYFCDRFRKQIFQDNQFHNPISLILDVENDFPASIFTRWTYDFLTSFHETAHDSNSKNEFLKFFVKLRLSTLNSLDENVHLNKKILHTISKFVLNDYQEKSVHQSSEFVEEIEKMINYTDDQLFKFGKKELHHSLEDHQVQFSIIQVFTLAYLNWIYSMLFKDKDLIFNFNSIKSFKEIKFYYDKYTELFQGINKSSSLKDICI